MRLIFTLLTFTGVLAAQSCTFTLSADQQSYPQRGGAGVVKVVASSSTCVRTTVSTVSWIVIDFGQQGTGNGTIGFTVASNSETPIRSGAITVGSESITITQAGPPCNFAINPNTANIPAGPQNGSLALTGLSGCSWTATSSNLPWLQVTSAASGMGPATVSYAVQANTATTSRSGTLSVAGLTFTVNQSGACVYTISPAGGSYPYQGGNGTVTISANMGCAWAATASASWIRITAGQSRSGPGQVMFAIDPNPGDSRTGFITVADQTFSVAQASLVCSYTLTPGTVAIASAGGTATFSVSAPGGCAWMAATTTTWIRIVTGTSNTGPGVVGISVDANAGDARTGVVTLGGKVFTVTQARGIQISISSIANSASYVQGAVSPGLIVILTVPGIGPALTVPAQLTADGAFYTTSLGETRVLFDGVAAPMVYAANGQFSAIVPYEVAGNPSTEVRIEFQGALSNSVTMPVVPSQPGLISADSTGAGPGMILDAASNLNSVDNPASTGSLVSLYITGEGQTSPPGVDGKLAVDPYPIPVLPVTVTIDGIDAPVVQAGEAPGQAGMMRIDVQIPDGAASGARPVVVQVGDAQSQVGVTVAIQ